MHGRNKVQGRIENGMYGEENGRRDQGKEGMKKMDERKELTEGRKEDIPIKCELK